MSILDEFKAGATCKCESDEGFEDLLSKSGIGWMQRKMASTMLAKPTWTFFMEGNDVVGFMLKGQEAKGMKFKMNGEMAYNNPMDDKPAKFSTFMEGDALVMKMVVEADGATTTWTRTLEGGKIKTLVTSSKADGACRTLTHSK